MEKIFESREKRELTKKFESMKSIGDVENLAEYEAKNWIEKSRRLEYEKKKAKEQAKVFDELDEDVFVSEDTKKAKDYNLRYSGADLTGLTVQHDIRDIKEGTTILTLKDSSLRNAQDDVLESSEVVSLEKSREFIENRKRKKVYNGMLF
ncbi:uncharacterized protein LOC135144379 [Zophobas morio]|uniref:uncharacterized protein LOC135144379 n=1 Tax=Zophobas morio TaxID=2755281 RepID=UPI003083A604